MSQRLKFILSALLLICICIFFFIPVFTFNKTSIKIFDFVRHYLDETTVNVKIFAQHFDIIQILRINEFFVALIFASALISLFTGLINIFIPNNKSAILPGLASLIGFIFSLIILNNVHQVVSLKNINIDNAFSDINEVVFIVIILCFLAASVLNFVIVKLEQPEQKIKQRKQSIFTNFFLRKRKFGTTKRPDFKPEDKTELIQEQNLRLLQKNDEDFEEE